MLSKIFFFFFCIDTPCFYLGGNDDWVVVVGGVSVERKRGHILQVASV